MSDVDSLVCARDEPGAILVPGSERMYCNRCGYAVMVAPTGQKRLAASMTMRVLCVPCGGYLMVTDPDAEIAPMTMDQAVEIHNTIRRN